MSGVVGATNQTPSTTGQTTRTSNMDDLNSTDFLKLMIAELQQQDPLNPMSNSDLVQQINSIRELSSTTALNDTLSSVLVGQNIATASGMIGKTANALTDDGTPVQGKVERVSVTVDPKDDTKREVRLHIGNKQVKISNVREIVN